MPHSVVHIRHPENHSITLCAGHRPHSFSQFVSVQDVRAVRGIFAYIAYFVDEICGIVKALSDMVRQVLGVPAVAGLQKIKATLNSAAYLTLKAVNLNPKPAVKRFFVDAY